MDVSGGRRSSIAKPCSHPHSILTCMQSVLGDAGDMPDPHTDPAQLRPRGMTIRQVQAERLPSIMTASTPEHVGDRDRSHLTHHMTYTFFDRDSDRIIRIESDTRLHAQLQIDRIGSWYCVYVETDTTVQPYSKELHR